MDKGYNYFDNVDVEIKNFSKEETENNLKDN